MEKTLLVTIDFPPQFGGVANYWANLCRFLPSEELVVLAAERDNSLDFDIKQSYLIYRKNLFFLNSWLWPKWLPLLYHAHRLIKKEKIKRVIVTHVLPCGTVAYLLKKFLRVSYIVSVHGLDLQRPLSSKRKTWLMKLVLKNAERIVANSLFTKNLLMKLGCCSDSKVLIVYPCPNVNFQKMDEVDKKAFLEKHGLLGRKIILTAGRLIERKGQDKVIEAMAMIAEKFSNAVCLIVGQGERLKYLQELAERLRLTKQVKFFTDALDSEMPFFYDATDLFLMPCRELPDGDIEGFGIVYLEANVYGKPVIAGRSGGAVEAVEHNLNGLLVNPLSVNEISQAAISLLENSRRARELGERGRQRVQQKFNWQEQAKKLISILN